ncbi:hypothetical protein Gferi_02935 [Geosporobacter ferrireducens]|uniref:HTH gntR-type domain-containing protein n=2 Tax=Geosporobacter ferrireducens TaxID=1424294 RepID=A0A1D8GPU2_9FIRM|nr:hypothetical protein Gferi_02935 [Geosporobacter ferrireducens]
MESNRMKKENLKQKAYCFIKSKIINCEYLPNTFLNESILMEEINTSRTPIREALNKLEQENLVTIMPKKGVVVGELSINEVNMIFQVRDSIEPYIIRTCGANIDKNALKLMRDKILNNIEQEEIEKFYQIDDAFHRFLISSSGNKYFHQTMDCIYNQIHRMRVLSGKKIDERLKQTQEEHLTIIALLLEDKVEESAEAMQKHLQNSKNATLMSLMI